MRVYHMSGAGNDFAVIDARGADLALQSLAVALCQQTGADGFMAVDTSQVADFRLHFYNRDGLRGEMCGNGARCICKFAYDLGLVGQTMTVQTDAGIIRGQRLGEETYRVELNLPSVLALDRHPQCAYVELGDPGVPHGLCPVETLPQDREQLRERGQALRYDPAFPKGANVTFYETLTPGHVRVLTYERGVEDFTLACGTGCASLAAVLWTEGKLPGGVLTAENPGGILTVTVTGSAKKIQAITLEGPAKTLKVFEY